MTDYLILHKRNGISGENEQWEPLGFITARSARTAIRERIDGVGQSSAHYGDGEYVAVPARSWQPVTVKTETKTQLRFS